MTDSMYSCFICKDEGKLLMGWKFSPTHPNGIGYHEPCPDCTQPPHTDTALRASKMRKDAWQKRGIWPPKHGGQ